MSFVAKYPASGGGGSSSNASVGTTGITAPTSATEVGYVDGSGNLQPVSPSTPLPTTQSTVTPGAATSANQTTEITALQAIQANQTNGSQVVALPTGASTSALQTSGNSSLTTIATNSGTQATAANQTTGNNSLSTIATQTNVSTNGASTSALQTSGNTSLSTIATQTNIATNGAATSALQTSGNASLTTIATNSSATQGTAAAGTAASKADLVGGVYNSTPPTLTTGQQVAMQLDVNGNQKTVLQTGANVIGALTANQSVNVAQYGGTSTTLGAKTSSASMPVVIATDQAGIATKSALGRAFANAPTYNAYATTNVTTAAYVQLIASTTSATNLVEIFDSSGNAMILAVGAAGSEVIQFYVLPGGNGQVPLAIPAGSRVSIKALTANSTSGYLLLNLYT